MEPPRRHSGPFLTQAEADALPIGAQVVVSWPQGIEPLLYRIADKTRDGVTLVETPDSPEVNYRHSLVRVGKEQWDVRVTLA